jgi:hypothetical protein
MSYQLPNSELRDEGSIKGDIVTVTITFLNFLGKLYSQDTLELISILKKLTSFLLKAWKGEKKSISLPRAHED